MAENILTTSPSLCEVGVLGWAKELRTQAAKFALLAVPTGQSNCDFDGSTDQITLAGSQTWQTGVRVRFEPVSFFGSPPSIAPLATGTDYWLIRISSTVFQLATSYSNAIDNVPATNLPTVGSQQYRAVAQPPSSSWPLIELANWEISHPLYTTRLVVPTNLPNTQISGSTAYQDIILTALNNTASSPYAYNTIAVLMGASATVGDQTGTAIDADLLFAPVSIAQGEEREIKYRLELVGQL